MYSPEYIRSMNREAEERARHQGKVPVVPRYRSNVEHWSNFPFPLLGDYRPEEWELVEELLCDMTGMGYEGEPALTVRQLKNYVKSHIRQELGYGIISVGQFQCVVGVFQRRGQNE